MCPGKCEKSETLLHEETKEKLEQDITDKEDDEHNISSCWTRVPGMGLILIIIKNILGGVSDLVAKKIENIGKFIAEKMNSKSTLLYLRLCEFNILQKSDNADIHNDMEYYQGESKM